MKQNLSSSVALFRGIALFTPGGDLVYCIDPTKRDRWHLQLCAIIQEVLGLAEPPHFLVPCYTATVDRWVDATTQKVCLAAEASPFVMQHQALLNAVFGLEHIRWRPHKTLPDVCAPMVVHQFRPQFPQLWKHHDLIIQADRSRLTASAHVNIEPSMGSFLKKTAEPQGYVLRLFISGKGSATEMLLKRLHTILERSLREPYTLKVVDISKNPEQAEADQISATPTLVKAWPLPVKRIIGDLYDAEALLNFLSSANSNINA
ncbi:MAG: circadian clock KaiB family protein [Elainellaceae cyanobacterium]